MRVLLVLLIAVSSLLLALFSYVNRLYREKGRFLIRGSKDNVEFFEEQVEPSLKIRVEEAELTFPLLIQLNIILLVLLVISWEVGRPLQWSNLLQGGVFVAADLLFFAEVIPHTLLARTKGQWLLSLSGLLRACILLVYPLVGISQFLHHVANLGREEEVESAESTSQDIEALMLAGEEEGLLEKEDRKLIRSVVEFGNKTVREVMTPRPEIFAVPADTSLADLKQMLATERYSRVPVFEGSPDHILGFVHARDILPLGDKELASTNARKLLRPISFVPESKPVSELLTELQQEKAHIAIVVDEYGSVAGLVTVEDMIEEIVGEIRDEHDALDVIPQGKRSFSVPGSMDLDRLQELFGVRIEEAGEATTVSGLVTGTMGRVPGPGEVLERDGLVFQVTESNGRKILRLLITGPEHPSVLSASNTPTAENGQKAS